MKRTYLAKRNALLSSASISWGVYAFIGAILVLLLRLIAPNFFWYTFTPVFRLSDALAGESHSFFSSFGDTAKLTRQNETLMDENTALALENKALLEKMNSLSALSRDTQGIIAGVVARPPQSPYDMLVLAKGTDDGVTLGMEAFGAGGTPLGIVSSVSANFSRITLFSAPSMSTSGWVGEKSLPITIQGVGAGALYASVARSADIAAGDIVFAPGPGELPIGSVVRVDNDPTSPSVILRIAPALNLFSLAWVTLRDTGITAFTLATSTSL